MVKIVRLVLVALAALSAQGESCRQPSGIPDGPSVAQPAVDVPPIATRHPVVLEVDRLQGVQDLRESQTIGGQTVSLAGIYGAGGIDVRVVKDRSDLPNPGDLSLADLHALMVANRSVASAAGEWHVYALMASSLRGRPSVSGVMFDIETNDPNAIPREGFAVFEDALPASNRDAEILLTAAHEMAHSFNLHHQDWEGSRFKRDSTIEGYSYADTVRWSLSRNSLAHLISHDQRLVRPGAGGFAFGVLTQAHLDRHRSEPPGDFSVLDPARDVQMAGRRPSISAAIRTGPTEAVTQGGLGLRVELPQSAYQVGEPVLLGVTLENLGDEPVEVVPALDPFYLLLRVELRAPGADGFTAFHPAVVASSRGIETKTLQPGESRYQDVKIFFGSEGWEFQTPGTWTVRALYVPSHAETALAVRSNSIEFDIVQPITAAARGSVDSLLAEPEAGLFMLLGGGDHLQKGRGEVERIAQEPSSPAAPYAKLALGQAALEPTVDPATGERPAPRVDEAEQYLLGNFDASLGDSSIVEAQSELADAYDAAGRDGDAAQLRDDIDRRYNAKDNLQHLLEPIQRELGR